MVKITCQGAHNFLIDHTVPELAVLDADTPFPEQIVQVEHTGKMQDQIGCAKIAHGQTWKNSLQKVESHRR